MTNAAFGACPNSDHDGVYAPATRRITVDAGQSTPLDELRCTYCAEGFVARLLRDGLRVTIEPLDSAS